LDNKRAMEMARQAGLNTYSNIQIPVKQRATIEEPQKEHLTPGQAHQHYQQQRRPRKPKKNKGRSI
jgi:hypothetical protein